MLKTLGFTRRQLAATTAWHATVATIVALAIGVPVGIAAGRLLWDQFAHQLDVVARPVVSMTVLVFLVCGAVLVANAVAMAPARAARRVRAAELLRAE
jgi:predicted lysophospholipase L1 biosynthesis ABC-type transport system permease subunit